MEKSTLTKRLLLIAIGIILAVSFTYAQDSATEVKLVNVNGASYRITYSFDMHKWTLPHSDQQNPNSPRHYPSLITVELQKSPSVWVVVKKNIKGTWKKKDDEHDNAKMWVTESLKSVKK